MNIERIVMVTRETRLEELLARFGSGDERLAPPALDWEAERLIFVVREPFASKTTGAA